MTENVKNLAPKILEVIKASKNILLHCHPGPDPDSVGSTLAMKFALESLGKKVTVIGGDSSTPTDFSHFPGFGDILQKNFLEVNLADFDLFIIEDSASLEMISRKGKGPIVFPEGLKTIVIDHHISNTKYARDINLVDATYPATALILYDLFKEWGIAITPDIASNLFIGIYCDTMGFRYSGKGIQGAATLAVAADLARIAPDFAEVISKMENNKTPEDFVFQGLAFSHIETFPLPIKNPAIAASPSNFLAISTVSFDELSKAGIKSGEDVSAGLIANLLKSVIGWDIAGCAIETEPGKVKTSFRTRDSNKYDMSVLAGKLGGGGHKGAAGAFLDGSAAEVKKKIVDAVATMI